MQRFKGRALKRDRHEPFPQLQQQFKEAAEEEDLKESTSTMKNQSRGLSVILPNNKELSMTVGVSEMYLYFIISQWYLNICQKLYFCMISVRSFHNVCFVFVMNIFFRFQSYLSYRSLFKLAFWLISFMYSLSYCLTSLYYSLKTEV